VAAPLSPSLVAELVLLTVLLTLFTRCTVRVAGAGGPEGGGDATALTVMLKVVKKCSVIGQQLLRIIISPVLSPKALCDPAKALSVISQKTLFNPL